MNGYRHRFFWPPTGPKTRHSRALVRDLRETYGHDLRGWLSRNICGGGALPYAFTGLRMPTYQAPGAPVPGRRPR